MGHKALMFVTKMWKSVTFGGGIPKRPNTEIFGHIGMHLTANISKTVNRSVTICQLGNWKGAI